jgi:glycosyltransferase involved in cell wall biosynthesis
MTTKRRVTFITTALNDGGAENQLVYLATQLQERGRWDTRVISMLDPKAYTERLRSAGIPVVSLGMRRGVPDPRAALRLAALLRRTQPQIIHSHMVHANLLARVTRLLYRVPVLISTAHNIDEGPDKRATSAVGRAFTGGGGAGSSRWRERGYRLTDPLCDLTTNVSRAAVDRYIQVGAVPRAKIRFVPNGVDTERFRPDPAVRERVRQEFGMGEQFVWLAVARFEEAKDHRTMIEAFASLCRSHPAASLLLVGQGTLEPASKALAASLGLGDRVRFLGVRWDVPDLMNAADAYVMSSAWEGLPMVLLEAAAVGLPAVATDVGGNSEIVADGETGFVVPPRDPAALASAMGRLMALSADERQWLGGQGRDRVVAQYSLDRVVDQWEDLYQALLARKGGGVPGGDADGTSGRRA